jgi:hypothetical protein
MCARLRIHAISFVPVLPGQAHLARMRHDHFRVPTRSPTDLPGASAGFPRDAVRGIVT